MWIADEFMLTRLGLISTVLFFDFVQLITLFAISTLPELKLRRVGSRCEDFLGGW